MKRVFASIALIMFAFIAVRSADAATCPPIFSGPFLCTTSSSLPVFSTPKLRTNSILSDAVYGWVEDYARFHDSPGGRRIWQAATGIFYGPSEETVTDAEGRAWHNVWGDWLPEDTYHLVEASAFSGVEVNRRPLRPFGWVLRPAQPHLAPGAGIVEDVAELQRYESVQVYDAIMSEDGAIWYEIGDGQWVLSHHLALVKTRERPEGVAADEFWVDVDLNQQVFAAYEGDRMVYAGLISSGLPRWPTHLGLYTVWERHLSTPMEGGVRGDDYYYIDAVPHTMYFDGDIALHGAYWHDDFGRPKSHGCVNMPPLAAEWVFFWSQNAPNDLRVWVHQTGYADFLS